MPESPILAAIQAFNRARQYTRASRPVAARCPALLCSAIDTLAVRPWRLRSRRMPSASSGSEIERVSPRLSDRLAIPTVIVFDARTVRPRRVSFTDTCAVACARTAQDTGQNALPTTIV